MKDTAILKRVGDGAAPLVLDSPHSGTDYPADFDAAVSEFDLRDGRGQLRRRALCAGGRTGRAAARGALSAHLHRSEPPSRRHRPRADRRRPMARRVRAERQEPRSAWRSSGACSTTAGRSTPASCRSTSEAAHRSLSPALPQRAARRARRRPCASRRGFPHQLPLDAGGRRAAGRGRRRHRARRLRARRPRRHDLRCRSSPSSCAATLAGLATR